MKHKIVMAVMTASLVAGAAHSQENNARIATTNTDATATVGSEEVVKLAEDLGEALIVELISKDLTELNSSQSADTCNGS